MAGLRQRVSSRHTCSDGLSDWDASPAATQAPTLTSGHRDIQGGHRPGVLRSCVRRPKSENRKAKMLQKIWTPWRKHGKFYTMKPVFHATECREYHVRPSLGFDRGVIVSEKWISHLHVGLTCKPSPRAHEITANLKHSFSKGFLTNLLFWEYYIS